MSDKSHPSCEANTAHVRLYIAGSTPQSSRVIMNIKTICETHLKDRYALTVANPYEQRERARGRTRSW